MRSSIESLIFIFCHHLLLKSRGRTPFLLGMQCLSHIHLRKSSILKRSSTLKPGDISRCRPQEDFSWPNFGSYSDWWLPRADMHCSFFTLKVTTSLLPALNLPLLHPQSSPKFRSLSIGANLPALMAWFGFPCNSSMEQSRKEAVQASSRLPTAIMNTLSLSP